MTVLVLLHVAILLVPWIVVTAADIYARPTVSLPAIPVVMQGALAVVMVRVPICVAEPARHPVIRDKIMIYAMGAMVVANTAAAELAV